jgi:diguanylate cyclase (GGDEF)-like protein
MSTTQTYIKVLKTFKSPGSNPFRVISVLGNNLIKRGLDISMSLLGLVTLAPVFIYVAILIKHDSAGPVFYWGPRLGKNGKQFNILKFRTMYEVQSSYKGPSITSDGDDRITPLGHWLRDTKINELPQLWNVLIGEMSLVGPRPEDVEIALTWPADAAKEILSVRPGITSPASILYHDEERLLRSTNPMEDYIKKILPDKMRLDRLYIRFNSFFSDIDIIFWTLAILVPQIAKTRIPEGYIFAGPFNVLVRRHLSWFLIDIFTTLISVTIAIFLWRINGALNWGPSHIIVLGILLAFLFSSVNSIFGNNKVIWSKAQSEDAFGLIFSCTIATSAILAIDYLLAHYQWLPYPPLASMMLLTIGLLAGVGFLTTRYRFRLITVVANKWLSWRKDKVSVGERMVIAGSGEGTQIASWLVQRRMFRTAFSVVGLVDHMDPTTYGMKSDGLWVLGSINDLPALLKKYDIGVVLSTLPPNSSENEYLFEIKKNTPIRIIFLKDLMWIVDQQVTRPVGRIDFPLTIDERLEYKALYDTLTELPNVALFRDRLRQSLAFAKRSSTQRACMFVEIKGLQLIPDVLDRNSLLKEIANRLNRTKREIDTLARFNDDMFALLLENVPNRTHLDIIIKRMSDALSLSFKFKGKEILIEYKNYVSLCNDNNCEASKNPENTNIKLCYECVQARNMVVKHEAIL